MHRIRIIILLSVNVCVFYLITAMLLCNAQFHMIYSKADGFTHSDPGTIVYAAHVEERDLHAT